MRSPREGDRHRGIQALRIHLVDDPADLREQRVVTFAVADGHRGAHQDDDAPLFQVEVVAAGQLRFGLLLLFVEALREALARDRLGRLGLRIVVVEAELEARRLAHLELVTPYDVVPDLLYVGERRVEEAVLLQEVLRGLSPLVHRTHVVGAEGAHLRRGLVDEPLQRLGVLAFGHDRERRRGREALAHLLGDEDALFVPRQQLAERREQLELGRQVPRHCHGEQSRQHHLERPPDLQSEEA
jgi:hypothetical protein